MHLQQTKRESRKRGGPQYYFHNLTEVVSTYLRKKKVVPVALVTPYGATPSHFLAVSHDAKLAGERVVRGLVGHDRIQQARAEHSIGEAIRDWYRLPTKVDFERIDVEISIHDEKFYLTPVACKLVGRNRPIQIQRPEFPLSYNLRYESQLCRKQLRQTELQNPQAAKWALAEIRRVVAAHEPKAASRVLESDLLRASGPLHVFGVELGAYLGTGLDCKASRFQFLSYLPYEVPVEIKKRSAGFRYQQQKYGKNELSRAVVLCVEHNLTNVPANIDVIELRALARLK
jgi:hypothetical protein